MIEDKQIAPHMPVWDKTARKEDTLSSSEFVWNDHANEYRCPAGKALRSEWRRFKNSRTHITKAETIIYRSSQNVSLTNRQTALFNLREITLSVI
jgi:hypothetical protein